MSSDDLIKNAVNNVQFAHVADLGDADIEALAFQVLAQANKDAQNDLRTQIAELNALKAGKGTAAENASLLGKTQLEGNPGKSTLEKLGKEASPAAGGQANDNDNFSEYLGKSFLGNGPVGTKIGLPIGGVANDKPIEPYSKLGSFFDRKNLNLSGSGYSDRPAPGPTGGGAAGSIILEPRQMFQTLQETENATRELINMVKEIAKILEAASRVTFAVGFSELVKVAEAAINQVGSAVVAANNAFNSACKEVVNQLVSKFASEGAKSDYSSPAFEEISIQVNPADRAQVYPSVVRVIFEDEQQHNRQLSDKTSDIRDLYRQTESFWVGTAADKTRQAFENRVVPKFEELLYALDDIVTAGLDWVDEAIRFEASLGV